MTDQAPVRALEGPTWALLELMGHRQLAGLVSEATLAGKAVLRVQIPAPGDVFFPQFYSPTAIFSLTPTSEENVRAWAARYAPDPASRFQLLSPVHDVDVVEGDEEEEEGHRLDDAGVEARAGERVGGPGF